MDNLVNEQHLIQCSTPAFSPKEEMCHFTHLWGRGYVICFLIMFEVAFCSDLRTTVTAGGEKCCACLTVSGAGALFTSN